ncbi:hypothetical protein FOA52_014829 [Chlamydomonas sp. UWO 241]|nr:hypothetical protein FOA52_014829 [Chlamydomonas sp. UWO 241]
MPLHQLPKLAELLASGTRALQGFARESARSARVRIGLVFALSLATTTLGAAAYKGVTGAPWALAYTHVYNALYNAPGADMTMEQTLAATVVINTTYVTGVLVFAVLLGMVGDEIATQVQSLRSGKGPVRLHEHILLLNWNSGSVEVLSQLAHAGRIPNHPMHNRPLVVLASDDKEEMEEAIAHLRVSDPSLELHPYEVKDLKLVSAADAAYVILMYPELTPTPGDGRAHGGGSGGANGGSGGGGGGAAQDAEREQRAKSDFESINAMTVAALSTFERCAAQQLVVQMRYAVTENLRQLDVLQGLLSTADISLQVVRLPERSVVDRLIAQSALQPGTLTFYSKVLQFSKQTGFRDPSFQVLWQDQSTHTSLLQGEFSKQTLLRWVDVPAPEGGRSSWTYVELRRRFHSALPVGYVSAADRQVHLNPDDECSVHPGDHMLVLQRGNLGSQVVISPAPGAYSDAAISAAARTAGRGPIELPLLTIIVAGWPPAELEDLVEGFVGFAPPNSVITFLLTELPEDLPESNEVVLQFEVVEDPLSPAALLDAGIESADAVVLGCSSELEYPDNDALILSTLYEIQLLMEQSGRVIHVVAKTQSAATRQVAKQSFKALERRAVTFELSLSMTMTSATLVQVAYQPLMGQVCTELMIMAEGNELYILPLSQLGLTLGEQVSVAEVYESARAMGMTMVGLIKQGGTGLTIAPTANVVITVEPGAMIIVIANLVNE